MSDLPITTKCPIGGEEWPFDSYKSTVDSTAGKLQYRHVHIWCPYPHDFSLRRAVNSGMFTKEQGERIFEAAQKLVKEHNAVKSS